MEHLDFYPRLVLGFTVGAGAVVLLAGILTEPHQSGQQTDISCAALSSTELLGLLCKRVLAG